MPISEDILTLEIEPPYIGSAVSPTVDIDETTDDITVTITDFRGEHSYTVEKTDGAIADAEQAAQNANDTAQTVAQGWANKLAEINGTLAQQREQMGSAAAAESQRITAENARVDAENAREQEWEELSTNAAAATSAANEAAGQANTAAQGAIGSANAANDATTRANNTITGITQTANQIFAQAGQATINANAAAQSATDAATLANTKAGLADTAAQNADTATTAANSAAQSAIEAAAEASVVSDEVEKTKSYVGNWLSKTITKRNINPLMVSTTNAMYVSTAGLVIAGSGVTSVMFPVIASETYYVNVKSGAIQALRGIIVGSSTNEFIAGQTYQVLNSTAALTFAVQIPDDVNYVLWYISASTIANIDELFGNSIIFSTSKNPIDKISIDSIDSTTLAFKYDIFDINAQLSRNGYFAVSNGNYSFIETNNAKSTEFIPVAQYNYFEYGAKISASGVAVLIVDENYGYVDSITGNSTIQTGTIDFSDYPNASYVAVSYYDASGEFPGFKAYAYNVDSLESRIAALEKEVSITTPQMLVFGDSITDNVNITVDTNDIETTAYTIPAWDNSYLNENDERVYFNMWPRLIQNVMNFSHVRNYAFSGASYKSQSRETGYERRNLDYQIKLAINDENDPNEVFGYVLNPDIVVFALGTNDGTPNDTPTTALAKRVYESDGTTVNVPATLAALDKTKFCEAAMWAYLTVKKEWPMSQGFVVLPIQKASNDTNGGTLHQYLTEMAEKFGYIVIDGYSDSGITRELNVNNGLGVTLKDGLHPNEKGQNLLTRLIATSIKRNYIDFDGLNT